MAFRMQSFVGGYGESESTFTPDAADTVINSYAIVTNIDGKILTLSGATNANAFQVNARVLVHISGYNGTAEYCSHIGDWIVTKITAVDRSNSTVTLEKDATELKGDGHVIQIVTVPEYGTLTLNSGKSITCPQFNLTSGGGIVALICSEELKFNGGHINLVGKGLPDTSIRTPLNQEKQYSGSQSWSGYENYQTRNRFTLNCPDGAAMIFAQKLTCHEDSRIGNPNTPGVKRVRGTVYNNHSRIFGGSSIMIVADEIANFTQKIIAKYSSQTDLLPANGKTPGLCRAYIATETTLPNDEGLYALDRIANKYRLSSDLNISTYGDGSLGSLTNVVKKWNSYGMVNKVTYEKKINKVTELTLNQVPTTHTSSYGKFKKGALIMIHTVQKRYFKQAGRFWITTIEDWDGLEGKMTLTDPAPYDTHFNLDYYYVQVIAIPQFKDFTLSQEYTATPAFSTDYGGGVCAIACDGTLNLAGGKILTANANSDVPTYGTTGLNYISNANMATRLPLGSGYGSVFILARTLTLDADSRIGAAYTGKAFGGGSDYGWGGNDEDSGSKNGSGVKAGTNSYEGNDLSGGFGSNAAGNFSLKNGGKQGAHIFIAANRINGLSLANLSTGGEGGYDKVIESGINFTAGGSGGCGFGGQGGTLTYNSRTLTGGRGGWHGGGAGEYVVGRDSYAQGGGAGGFCFVYCNSHSSQDTGSLLIY